jgi:hypothetical protein
MKNVLLAGLLSYTLFGFGWVRPSLDQMYASYFASRLQDHALILQVTPLKQSLATSCGEAVIVMAYNYAYPQDTINEPTVIDYAIEQGYYTPDLPPFTRPDNMVKIVQHYANDYSTGTVGSSIEGILLLVRRLQKGEPVVIDILSWLDDPHSAAHFVLVTGVSVDSVNGRNEFFIHYNDPLTGRNDAARWAGENGIWNAWKNNGDPGGSGWWLVIPPS